MPLMIYYENIVDIIFFSIKILIMSILNLILSVTAFTSVRLKKFYLFKCKKLLFSILKITTFQNHSCHIIYFTIYFI